MYVIAHGIPKKTAWKTITNWTRITNDVLSYALLLNCPSWENNKIPSYIVLAFNISIIKIIITSSNDVCMFCPPAQSHTSPNSTPKRRIDFNPFTSTVRLYGPASAIGFSTTRHMPPRSETNTALAYQSQHTPWILTNTDECTRSTDHTDSTCNWIAKLVCLNNPTFDMLLYFSGVFRLARCAVQRQRDFLVDAALWHVAPHQRLVWWSLQHHVIVVVAAKAQLIRCWCACKCLQTSLNHRTGPDSNKIWNKNWISEYKDACFY